MTTNNTAGTTTQGKRDFLKLVLGGGLLAWAASVLYPVLQATNPDARDFRLDTLGSKWEDNPLNDQGDGVYVGKVTPPAKGWTAFVVELTFPTGSAEPFKFTTQVRVLPEVTNHKFVPQRPSR